MKNTDCLFCKIVAGEELAEKVWESEEFIAIKNKFPTAPIHILVMPKAHIRKQEVSVNTKGEFWGKIMSAVFSVVSELNPDLGAYKLVNNGIGYAHFEHEHVHILGGSKTEPGGAT